MGRKKEVVIIHVEFKEGCSVTVWVSGQKRITSKHRQTQAPSPKPKYQPHAEPLRTIWTYSACHQSIIAETSKLLRRSQLLLLLCFNSLSASINLVWIHILYLLSPRTLSQLRSSVNVLLICWLTSFNFISSCSISPRILSSITVGRDDLLVLSAGRGRDGEMLPPR